VTFPTHRPRRLRRNKLIRDSVAETTLAVERLIVPLFVRDGPQAVIDFWAEWCPPCFLISPIIEEMARDYPDVGFGKLNYDEGQDIAYSLGVMNLPTILMFKHGKPVDGVIGAVPRICNRV